MFSICHLNIRSLSKHFDEFVYWTSLYNHDVICISESWLNSSHFNSTYKLPGYVLIRRDRDVASRGGGLVIYIKDSIKFERVDMPACRGAEILVIKVIVANSELCIALVYNPPSSASHIVDQFASILEANLLKKRTIIIGDFNIDWSSDTSLKENFDTLMSLHNFQQIIDVPTRCFKDSKTIIDLLFSNCSDLIQKHQVLNCDISDHFAIECQLSLQKQMKTYSFITKRDFRKFDEFEFFEATQYFNFHSVENLTCPHQAAEMLEKHVCNLTDQFAPFKTQRLRNKRAVCWRSPAVSKLMREAKAAFQDFIDSGFDKFSESWLIYKAIRNKKNNAIRDAKRAALEGILHDNSLTQWEKIKIFKGTNTDQENKIDELEIDGTKCTDNLEIANGLNQYFSTIGIKLNDEASIASIIQNHQADSCDDKTVFSYPKFTFQEVSNVEVSKVLHSLKSRKNGGLNQIPAFIYKILEPVILNPLTHIINRSLSTHKFPDVWKQALTIPIFKSGAKNLASNYRLISLLPILSKVLEKIVSQQIRDYVEANALISSRQFGFRTGTSTDQILLQLVNKIRHLLTLENSKFVTLAALDIKKRLIASIMGF